MSIACTPVNNRTDAIAHKTDSLRVVAIGTFAHVAIGTFPTATRADYMIIEGEAASAATIISVVADRRVITKNSHMLIHQMSTGFWGKYNEFLDEMKKFETDNECDAE